MKKYFNSLQFIEYSLGVAVILAIMTSLSLWSVAQSRPTPPQYYLVQPNGQLQPAATTQRADWLQNDKAVMGQTIQR